MMKKSVVIISILILAVIVIGIWAVLNLNKLNEVQDELSSATSQVMVITTEFEQTKDRLAETETELAGTHKELNNTQNRLDVVEAELDSTKHQWEVTRDELDDTESKLSSTEDELTEARSEMARIESELSSAGVELTSVKDLLTKAQERLALTEETLAGLGITVSLSSECRDVELVDNPDAKNPTWLELMEFLSQDMTQANRYIENVYDCSQFSRDVHNNAEVMGIRAGVVHVWFTGRHIGHALNAFITTDYGLVYVDCTGIPDKIARVVVGESLIGIEPNKVSPLNIRNDTWWNSLIWTLGYIYMSGDTPPTSIKIYW